MSADSLKRSGAVFWGLLVGLMALGIYHAHNGPRPGLDPLVCFPAGVGLALLVRLGARALPLLAILSLLYNPHLSDVRSGASWTAWAANVGLFAFAHTLQPWLAWRLWLKRGGFPAAWTLKDVFAFLVWAVMVAPLLSAWMLALSPGMLDWNGALPNAPRWFVFVRNMGREVVLQALGTLVVTPLASVLAVDRQSRPLRAPLTLALLALLPLPLFLTVWSPLWGYLAFPFLLAIILRARFAGAAAGLALCAVVVVILTDQQIGPWTGLDSNAVFAHLAAAVMVLGLTAIVLGVMIEAQAQRQEWLAGRLGIGALALEKAQISARESEERFRAIAEHLPGVVYQLFYEDDGRMRFTYISAGVKDLCELAPADILADPECFFSLIHPDDRETVLRTSLEAFHRRTSWTSEWRIRTPSGRVKWILGRDEPQQLADGSYAWIWFAFDITERRQAEQILQDSERRLQRILDELPAGVVIMRTQDSLGEVAFASRSFLRLTGYTRGEVADFDSWARLAYPDPAYQQALRVKARAMEDEARRTGRPAGPAEGRVKCKDGAEKTFAFYYVIIESYGLWTLEDISARVRLEEDLRQSRDAAQTANLAKTAFLAQMSHELRTPLNPILGFANLLAQQQTLTPQHREWAELIRERGEDLLALVNDLLDLSRIESGHLQLTFQDADLRTLAQECLEAVHFQAEAKGLHLDCRVDESAPVRIRADPRRIRQILLNLVGNAVKFTDKGSVSLEIEQGDPAALSLAPRPDETLLHARVRDTGVGIPSDKLAVIFEPFVQVEPSGNRRHPGVGLGLAIAQRLAERFGGRIWAESRVGQGSVFHAVFWVGIPSGKESLPPRPETTASPSPTLNILLVEDDPSNRELARLLLEQMGHRVIEAADGRQALARFAEDAFDLVVMDIQMPHVDGLTATVAIREQDKQSGRHTPVVAMTAYAMPEDQGKFLMAGLDSYVAKPVTPAALARAIQEALARAARVGT